MTAPLTIRFATDHAGAKAGIQDLAASVVSNMVRVSGALNTGVQANGGYAAAARTLATGVVTDFQSIASAGLKAANDTNVSGVAIGAALGRAAAQSQTAGVVMKGGFAVAAANAQFALTTIRNEAAATWTILRNSPTFMGIGTAAVGLAALAFVLHETGRAGEAAEARIAELVKIANTAAGAGVGTTFLQGLTGQAKDLGLQVDAVTRALESAREAATTRIGEGDKGATSAFEERLDRHRQAGNIGAADLERYRGAESQEARIRVVIDLVDQLRAKGAQLAAFDIAGKFFGSDFENKLRTGVDLIGAVRKALDGVGAAGGDRVFSEAEIQRAQALQDRIQEINNKLADGLRPIMEDIALWQQQQVGGWLDIKDKIADCIVSAGKLYLALKEAGSAFGNADIFVKFRDWLDSKGLIDHAEVKRIETMLSGGTALAKVGAPKDGEAQAGGDNTAPLSIRVSPKKDTSRSLPSQSSGRSGSDDTDAIDTYIDGLKKSAAALKAEVEAFGLSNAAKAEAIALAKAKSIADANGTTLTEAQTAAVKEAARASADYKDKLADLEQGLQRSAEASRYFGNMAADSLADALLDGKKFADILNNIERQLLRSALQGLFTGQGVFGGLLGTAPAASSGGNAVGGIAGLVGGLFRAGGGPVRAGQSYTVGELGREIFVPDQNGRVVPIGSGGGPAAAAAPINVYNYAGDREPVTAQRRGDGGVDVIVGQLDAALARRLGRGQGALATALPQARTLRG